MRPALGLHRLGVVLVAAAVLALATAMHVSPVMAVDPPVLTSLDPDSAPAYGAGFTLTVNGTGFVAGSTVLWNGSARTTYTVSTALVSGSAETVGLAVTAGLPAGASAVFNPATVSAGGSSSLTVATSGSTPPSTSTLTITGTAFGDPRPHRLAHRRRPAHDHGERLRQLPGLPARHWWHIQERDHQRHLLGHGLEPRGGARPAGRDHRHGRGLDARRRNTGRRDVLWHARRSAGRLVQRRDACR